MPSVTDRVPGGAGTIDLVTAGWCWSSRIEVHAGSTATTATPGSPAMETMRHP
ncbi:MULTISPECIES: hypothetical protein [unclassified Streptomyces]|uniref:hypothetical protein n=1 Tax=unclassified Streptomyces TaxID=2593676 RepID=UPI001300F94C|nr:hypothetical protein [Streptomyces sp. TSRI0281]